ncbi:unnamed protein product [Parnassius mnemosyne]|uniref:HTH psq-type domain-containing protein n=1 Tax=Parnassius mnemosyne TaxID=213953 RepID=A0AAV1KRU8_9NEOP
MGRYIKKGLRGNWRQEDLQAALNAVTNGQKIKTAAKEFKMPRRTRKRYLKTKQILKSHLGRKPLLSSEQEN